MPLATIKVVLESDQFEDVSQEVVATAQQVGNAADKSLGKATAKLSETGAGIENLKSQFDSLVDKIGAPIPKFSELESKISASAASSVKSVGGIKKSLTGLERDSQLPLKNVTGDIHKVSSAITQIDFPFMSDGFRSVTREATNFVNVLATSTGGIAAAVFAVTALGGVIASLITREKELTEQRRMNAEETIKIIQAEIDRIAQSEKTDKAVDASTGKLKLLNDELIRQQLLLSDINLKVMREELNETQSDVNDFVKSINRVTNVRNMLIRDNSATAIIARELFQKFSGDIVQIQKEVENQLVQLIIKESDQSKKLSDEEIFSINVRKEALGEIKDKISAAAEAQKNYNREIENQQRLIEALNRGDRGIAPPNIETPELTEAPPIVRPVEIGEVRQKEIALQTAGIPEAEIIEAQQFEIRMVELKFQNHLTSEEQYLNDRRALLEQQAQFMVDFYGAESQQALEANLKKLQFDEEYTRKKQQLERQAASNALALSAGIMANAQGVSEFLFDIGKTASIAQATIDTYAAANLALKTYPPPFGAIAAAASIATGLLNVSKITATKFERRAEGGILGSGLRQVLAADFGGGENGLFIGNSGEFVVNAKSTEANRALLELINASEGAVRMNRRQDGGAFGSTNTPAGSGAVVVNPDMSDVVQAIREIKIEVRAELDSMRFFREKFPVYEKEEARRRLA